MTKSATRNGPGDWQNVVGPEARSHFGRVRRFVLGLTTKALWQVLGHVMLDGKRESRQAEVFGGAGIAARPGGRNAECVVVFPGDGASAPLIVAVRDEQMRQAIVAALSGGELAAGEVALGSGTDGTVAALVHVKADGTIEARSAGGTAAALATKADLDAFKAAIVGWTPAAGDGGAALRAALMTLFAGPPVWPAGTSVLQGE